VAERVRPRLNRTTQVAAPAKKFGRRRHCTRRHAEREAERMTHRPHHSRYPWSRRRRAIGRGESYPSGYRKKRPTGSLQSTY
jgi:hypothetical protein